jgi:hypothetical protein
MVAGFTGVLGSGFAVYEFIGKHARTGRHIIIVSNFFIISSSDSGEPKDSP